MKSLYSLILFIFLASCSGNSVDDKNCRFLLDIGVNHTENFNLSPLNGLSNGSAVIIYPPNTRGIIISNNGVDRYVAFDAADPNHSFETCSELSVSYPIATCNCEDGNKFSLLDGAPIGNEGILCPLKMYKTVISGNLLQISN